MVAFIKVANVQLCDCSSSEAGHEDRLDAVDSYQLYAGTRRIATRDTILLADLLFVCYKFVPQQNFIAGTNSKKNP